MPMWFSKTPNNHVHCKKLFSENGRTIIITISQEKPNYDLLELRIKVSIFGFL